MFAFFQFFAGEAFKVVVGDFHAFAPGNLWLPVENGFGPANVWLALQGIILGQFLVNDLLIGSGKFDDLLGKILDRDFVRIPNIHGIAVIAQQKSVNSFHLIIDITKRTGLRAIAKNGEVFSRATPGL